MFNPQARWDRSLPINKSNNSLDESIEVLTFFQYGKILPRYFQWKKKGYKIRGINYYWHERNGHQMINYFSVNTSSGDIYQISFNNKTYIWKIEKIIEQK